MVWICRTRKPLRLRLGKDPYRSGFSLNFNDGARILCAGRPNEASRLRFGHDGAPLAHRSSPDVGCRMTRALWKLIAPIELRPVAEPLNLDDGTAHDLCCGQG